MLRKGSSRIRRIRQLSGWLVGCVVLIATQSSAAEQTDLHSSANNQFEVVAVDLRSARFVEELSRHVVDRSSRFLERHKMDFPQRVLVRLKPERFVDFEGAYRLTLEPGGFVTLDLRWTEALELATCCRALSEALLLRYSLFNFGLAAAEQLREWTVSVLTYRTLLGLRPASREALFAAVQAEELPPVPDLLAQTWDAPDQGVAGYLLLRTLSAAGLGQQVERRLFRAAVAGRDVAPALTTILDAGRSAEAIPGFGRWWTTYLPELSGTGATVFERIAVSRQWIDQLSRFQFEGEPINLKQLWERRDDPEMRAIVEARLEIVRFRINRVNPAYFNAAHSLGLLFETILEGDRAHEFIGSLGAFLSDFEDTKAIESIVRAHLDESG